LDFVSNPVRDGDAIYRPDRGPGCREALAKEVFAGIAGIHPHDVNAARVIRFHIERKLNSRDHADRYSPGLPHQLAIGVYLLGIHAAIQVIAKINPGDHIVVVAGTRDDGIFLPVRLTIHQEGFTPHHVTLSVHFLSPEITLAKFGIRPYIDRSSIMSFDPGTEPFYVHTLTDGNRVWPYQSGI